MKTSLLLVPLLLLFAGCVGVEQASALPPGGQGASQLARAAVPHVMPTAGAIYASGTDVAWFEDTRARRVGDLITVLLQESTNASKSNSTKTKKATSIDNSAPTLAGRGVTIGGKSLLQASAESGNQFQGEGASTQSNALQGSLTAVVTERLPNGNLVVQGEKWLQLNQGEEFVRVTGVVRAADILPDNTVTSDKVADARISYGGKGAVQSASRMGWLARFFNSALVPF